ncbi:MAG: secondary thiamine-phosphate synthase enzyme YjbQ [Candidatus Omnitrophota bacterium]
MQKITVQTTGKEEFIDITAKVQEAVRKMKHGDGVCTVFTPHTTAAITINENADPNVVRDILHGLRKMVPETGHHHAEGNSPAHIKSSIIGCSEQVPVENDRLALGTWQGIYFCEFDGPRNRTIFVKKF